MKNFLLLSFLSIATGCFAQPGVRDYTALLQLIENKKADFHTAYSDADSVKKDSIVSVAQHYLISTITAEIFSYWYGTPWDFNGMTKIPRQGKIACGYFVTTVLQDAGFKIPRIKWAQSPSEVFIKKLSEKNQIKRFSGKPIAEIEEYLKAAGDGLHLVGLDMHVGFLSVKNGYISFIHSNYYKPETGVMAESLQTKNPLTDSNYIVVGKLMSRQMVVNWINGVGYN